jgi:hypothetical protein
LRQNPKYPFPSVINKRFEKLVNFHPWVVNRNKALILPSILHDMHVIYLNPFLDSMEMMMFQKNMSSFQDYTDNLEIQHDDVFMRIFCHSLEGDYREWFRNLPVGSISCWMDFHDVFLDQWA